MRDNILAAGIAIVIVGLTYCSGKLLQVIFNHLTHPRTGMGIGKVEELKTLDEVKLAMSKDEPLIIEYFADWCGACKQFAPVLNEVASDMNRVHFYSVNADKNGFEQHEKLVQYLPTVLVGRNPSEVLNHPCEVIASTNTELIKKQINVCLGQ